MLLYPPIIEGQLPPAVLEKDEDQNEIITFTIPYEINRGVDPLAITGYIVKIKNLISDKLLKTYTITNFQNSEIKFEIEKDNNFNSGDHYKIQVAFIDSNEAVGYFSTVGVCKLIIPPKLSLEQKNGNWIGTYMSKDSEDLLYSSCFILKNESGQIIEKSEDKIANYLNQDQESQNYIETYRFKHSQKIGHEYTVEWYIETASGYKTSAQETTMINNEILQPDHILIPMVRFNEDSGRAELAVKANFEASSSANYGQWVITKASSKDNFSAWTEILKIENFYSWYLSKSEDTFDNILIKDYDIEHGVEYQYALQQINDYGIYSYKINTPIVIAKFEDMYLCDNERQLRIAFNPKISSMKNSILESKQNTIGGKYPYIFRNGQVNHKEFNISGLISYLEDPDNDFKMEYEDLKTLHTTNLTHENFSKERQFKLAVLEWLNNGKPKLLKTSAEGNYLVYLMNVSLSPNDTLGRMLHTFNATAVEVEDKTFSPKIEIMHLLSESPIQVTTLTEGGLGIMQQNAFWYETSVKELWFYADSRVDFYEVTITLADGKKLEYKIGQSGQRIQFYNQDGIRIQNISYKDIEIPSKENNDIVIISPPNIIIDVYYTNTPSFKRNNKIFANTSNVVLKEYIGTGKPLLGTYFYKVLTVTEIDANMAIKDKKLYNNITYTNTRGEKQQILVIDQLRLEDVIMTDLVLGDNLESVYCCVGSGNDFDIINPEQPV